MRVGGVPHIPIDGIGRESPSDNTEETLAHTDELIRLAYDTVFPGAKGGRSM